MSFKEQYLNQARLLLKVLPFVMENEDFALMGGTAINMFYKDLPRLSVDIDLVYLPIEDREKTLKSMTNNLEELSRKLKRVFPDIRIDLIFIRKTKNVHKLMVREKGFSIKIEVNLVQRGSIYSIEKRALVKRAEDLIGRSFEVTTLLRDELYGGKFCAALNRQHPRDLFDVNLLLKKEDFSKNLMNTFVLFLSFESRPAVELLKPNLIDIDNMFKNQFFGMVDYDIKLEDLLVTKEQLIRLVNENLNADHKRFLVSIQEGDPKWDLTGVKNFENLPSIKWKLLNVKKMDEKKRVLEVNKLKEHFGMS